MITGFTTLAELKQRLLPASQQSQTVHDNAIASVGRGVAGLFDRACNRNFLRAEGTTSNFSGGRDHFFLPRYPLESITKVEQRESYAGGWVELTVSSTITEIQETTGYIGFTTTLGANSDFIRVTYTGGYWIDAGEGESMPSTATPLPEDVREAFFLQCESVWSARDKLGQNLAKTDAGEALSKTALLGLVKTMLQGHIRYMMT